MSIQIEASVTIDGVNHFRELCWRKEIYNLMDFLEPFDDRVYSIDENRDRVGILDYPDDIIQKANVGIPYVRPKSPDDKFYGDEDLSDESWYRVRDFILFASTIRSGLYGSY